jgi:hypothetical protein
MAWRVRYAGGMKLLLTILFLSLIGCTTPQQSFHEALAECEAIADQYRLVETRAFYLQECVKIPKYATVPTGYVPAPSAPLPLTGYNQGLGPFGPMGPTWQQFNSQYQPNMRHQIITPPPPGY